MRLRLRLRSVLIGVAMLAIGLAAWVTIERRTERFTHLAAYHLQAHFILAEQADGPRECLEPEDDDWETAVEQRFAARRERVYLAYEAATYHWDLFEKYRKAAASPWLSVRVDPLPPQMANPRFNADSGYVETVRDWDYRLSCKYQ
jgi:hypothetical protein